MNTYLGFWGALVALSGFVMHLLLIGLDHVTFWNAPIYLPPAQIVSYCVIAAGLVMFAGSFFVSWPRYAGIGTETASRYFGRVALVNAVAAAVFVTPMLVPQFNLPILVTEWAGIYIVISYVFFVIVGVLGMLAWSVMYRLGPTFFPGRDLVDRRSVLLQLVLSEIAIYSVSTVLFAAGYIGAHLLHDVTYGNPLLDPLVGASMEFSDIPAAVSIFLMVVSVVLGAVTIMTGRTRPFEAGGATASLPNLPTQGPGGGIRSRETDEERF